MGGGKDGSGLTKLPFRLTVKFYFQWIRFSSSSVCARNMGEPEMEALAAAAAPRGHFLFSRA